MAEPFQIDEVLDYVADAYNRQPHSTKQREIWHDEFREADAAMLLRVVQGLCRTSKYPPSLAEAVAAMEQQAPTQERRASGPAPCPDCRVMSGWREMAIRWRDPDGTERSRALLAACECRAGAMRQSAGAKTWREVWATWQAIRDRLVADGGEVLSVSRTHRDRPVLDDRDRETGADLGRWPKLRRSEAAAFLVASLRAGDEHARERRRWAEREEIEEAS